MNIEVGASGVLLLLSSIGPEGNQNHYERDNNITSSF